MKVRDLYNRAVCHPFRQESYNKQVAGAGGLWERKACWVFLTAGGRTNKPPQLLNNNFYPTKKMFTSFAVEQLVFVDIAFTEQNCMCRRSVVFRIFVCVCCYSFTSADVKLFGSCCPHFRFCFLFVPRGFKISLTCIFPCSHLWSTYSHPFLLKHSGANRYISFADCSALCFSSFDSQV